MLTHTQSHTIPCPHLSVTGSSSVIIDPNAEVEGSRFRGRSVLGRGAMNVAYFLFAAVGFTGVLVAIAVVQELAK